MYFDDPAFLPIRYSFKQVRCDGWRLHRFDVPKDVPNGQVDIVWYASRVLVVAEPC